MAREVSLKDEEGDYEVIPVTPLRKLEKRLEQMETSKSAGSMERIMDKIIEMVSLNQRIVDEMIKANVGLREDVSTLIGKMDSLQSKLTNFIEIVESAGQEETESSEAVTAIKNMMKPMIDSIGETNNKVVKANQDMVNSLSLIDKRLKRMNSDPNASASMFSNQAPPGGQAPQ
ncbi:MAG: hypothetical protein KAJ54_03410 [Candidatus Aenigmarchaeota archaeon]|nr:hypothetical protein [Candidatus Aenigmarchaeota archaeon]